MKKLFICGAGGLTGFRLCFLAKERFELFGSYNNRNPNLDFVNLRKLNIINEKDLTDTLYSINPDFVINAAALSNVDYCESHKNEANEVNVKAVKKLFDICESLGSKLVHISSDSVFDGTKNSPYNEEDPPMPVNCYGMTKFEGEKIVLKNPKNLVVRVSVLYGWLPNYLSKISSSSMKHENFAQWLIKNLLNQKDVNIITDEICSPIIADDLAKSIIHLIDGGYNGIYHSAPPVQISRHEFSLKIAKCLGLNEKLIHAITNKELGRSVTTGKNKCLNSNKISEQTKFKFLSLEESLNLLKKHTLG